MAFWFFFLGLLAALRATRPGKNVAQDSARVYQTGNAVEHLMDDEDGGLFISKAASTSEEYVRRLHAQQKSESQTFDRCPESPGMITLPEIDTKRRVRGCCAELRPHTQTKDNDLRDDSLAKKVVENATDWHERRVFYCKAFLVHGPDRCNCGDATATMTWGGADSMYFNADL